MINNPPEITATMIVTLTLAQWENLRDELSSGSYGSLATVLSSNISDLITQARKVFYPTLYDKETKNV